MGLLEIFENPRRFTLAVFDSIWDSYPIKNANGMPTQKKVNNALGIGEIYAFGLK